MLQRLPHSDARKAEIPTRVEASVCMSDAEQIRDRAKRLWALALKARHNNLNDYAGQDDAGFVVSDHNGRA
jgi:hypothetical protein